MHMQSGLVALALHAQYSTLSTIVLWFVSASLSISNKYFEIPARSLLMGVRRKAINKMNSFQSNIVLNLSTSNCHGRTVRILSVLLLYSLSSSLIAQTESTVQSSARPLGLDIIGPVSIAASDRDSYEFQTQELPDILTMVNQKLDERAAIDDSLLAIDPTKLTLGHQADVRVYFIGEGAGYHNTLGVNPSETGVMSGDPSLIFPDASSRNSYLEEAASNQQAGRSSSYPLAPGDFVDLGTIESGSTLDFFLIANGVYGGNNIYSTDASINPDGINHIVALAGDDSPYLIIGFEDLYGGGDRDFNDLIFAVDIGTANMATITATPEPALTLMLAILGAAASLPAFRKHKAEVIAQLHCRQP